MRARALVRGLAGEHVSLTLAGRPLTAVVQLVRLRGAGARLDLRDVEWDGVAIDVVSAQARGARVQAVPGPRVRLTDVDVVGRAPVAPLVAWLNERHRDWSLAADEAGRVHARHRFGVVAAVGELEIREHRVRAVLRGLSLRRRALPFLPPLRPAVSFDLPALPNDVSLAEARVREGLVDFHLRIPQLEWRA